MLVVDGPKTDSTSHQYFDPTLGFKFKTAICTSEVLKWMQREGHQCTKYF